MSARPEDIAESAEWERAKQRPPVEPEGSAPTEAPHRFNPEGECQDLITEAYERGVSEGRRQAAAERSPCPICNPGSPDDIRRREEASAALDRAMGIGEDRG